MANVAVESPLFVSSDPLLCNHILQQHQLVSFESASSSSTTLSINSLATKLIAGEIFSSPEIDIFLDTITTVSRSQIKHLVETLILTPHGVSGPIRTILHRILSENDPRINFIAASALEHLSKSTTQNAFLTLETDIIRLIFSSVQPFPELTTNCEFHTTLLSSLAALVKISNSTHLDHLPIKSDDKRKWVRDAVFDKVLDPAQPYLSWLSHKMNQNADHRIAVRLSAFVSHILHSSGFHEPTLNMFRSGHLGFSLGSLICETDPVDSIPPQLCALLSALMCWRDADPKVFQRGREAYSSLVEEGADDQITLLNSNRTGRCVGSLTVIVNALGGNLERVTYNNVF
ncbi:hypothetical protein BLNAU_8241 [Blattamonas nauphoetae]|uniref:Uncharacterized protein n=1 Tax=Blattamonas nauphoetae TaxID=2049346 RepID=A0ABQ9XZ97_9EUKA|nr:hypothetical protein BLNAU_8241 [Blattamonas nauphoetae]